MTKQQKEAIAAEVKPSNEWFEPPLEMLKKQSHEGFKRQYLVDFEITEKRCEVKSFDGKHQCPEQGIERLIDDETAYLCDKCYKNCLRRTASGRRQIAYTKTSNIA